MIYAVRLTKEKKTALENLGFSLTPMKCPYKNGDKVRLLVDIKDGYGDQWHKKGDIKEVSYLNDDGIGLMFSSGLGVPFTHVEPA